MMAWMLQGDGYDGEDDDGDVAVSQDGEDVAR